MIDIEKKFPKGNLHLHAVPMGNDWCISVFGGDKPHIGAVSVAHPRASLEDPAQISSTASLITLTGHMEDLLARKLSLMLAASLNCVVSVSMGIHIDHATPSEIQEIDALVKSMGEEMSERAC